MLQKLFGYKVELVEHSSEYTLVKGDSPVTVGTQISVRVSDAKGRRTPSVPMVVVSCRPCEGGGYLISGKFLVDHPDLTGFEIPESVSFDASLRAAPRVEAHLCVLSRDLPGYRVMTIDLSAGGLQVETPAEVAVGASVLLRLEFDTDRLPPIETSASVAWCSQLERGKYRIGLKFRSLDERSLSIIEVYHQLLEKRQQADVQTRTVRSDESLLDGMELPEAGGPNESQTEELAYFEWKPVYLISNATLYGYLRESRGFKICLRGGNGGLTAQEFSFGGLREVTDRLDCEKDSLDIASFRYASISENYFRFQFLNPHMEVVLEIVARTCRETSTKTN